MALASTDQEIASLPISVAQALFESMKRSDPQQAAYGAWVWLSQAPNMSQYAERDLVRLVVIAVTREGKTKEERDAFITGLEQIWTGQGSTIRGDYTKALAMSRIHRWTGNLAKSQQWMLRAYQFACGSVDARRLFTVQEIGELAENLIATHPDIPGQLANPDLVAMGPQPATTPPTPAPPAPEFAELAATLAFYAQQGTLRSHWSIEFGRLLSGPQSRQILAAELLDPAGSPRIEVAHILAWAYWAGGNLKSWQDQIDAKLADGQLSPDARALWLIANGFAQELKGSKPEIRNRRTWLDQALASAQSEPVASADIAGDSGFSESPQPADSGSGTARQYRRAVRPGGRGPGGGAAQRGGGGTR